ncbi:hypothetical protein BCV69DRAFT_297137 [Microstroma glucosiphilum]|uniref:Uncharacterized protein n=1 Tax=Pseudomicrostroma glucosiphilum TaxID=1684307 RepID=A0A316UDB3_9BASI|nr:hypothetical protein BCV69DRAFT_297137 [Pseudomicrostroma glucosiphilum]PWN23189.1 hypothetical protein BCV69DRAFT_297137 [Pseudomicrostroma glucosiphilum]
MSSSTSIPRDLPSLIAKQYDSALSSGSAFFYPSDVHSIKDQEGEDGPSMQWTVRRCEALREKAKEKKRKEEAKSGRDEPATQKGGQNPSDVFAPPYDKDLLIAELGDHTLLLNKFALIPHHFLLVTRDFQPQTMPPSPDTLRLAFEILSSVSRSLSTEILCFYNCGPVSGASQAHCHLQFVNLESGGGVLVEQLLGRIQKDGKEMETVHALPLPYQHFVHLLPPGLSSRSADDITSCLSDALMKLLDAMFSAQAAAISHDDGASAQPAPARRGARSWNLLLTGKAMHLIPRDKEDFPLGEEGPQNEEVGHLSLNALCFAGHLVTKSNEEVERIKSHPGGVRNILSQVGRRPVSDFTVATPNSDAREG